MSGCLSFVGRVAGREDGRGGRSRARWLPDFEGWLWRDAHLAGHAVRADDSAPLVLGEDLIVRVIRSALAANNITVHADVPTTTGTRPLPQTESPFVVARGRFNAARDWVGSYVITINRPRE